MDIRVFLSVVATIIAVVSYIPYVRDMVRGKTKPHAFSWFVWALLAYIAVAAQWAGGGGMGALVALVTGTISLGIAIYAFKHSAITITRGDRISLAASLGAIPLWLLTNDPLLSVVLISVIDLVAFWPTIRKSYHLPHSETLSQQWMAVLKHFLTVGAQQHYSLVTILFPLSLGLSSLFFATMLMVRRRRIIAPVVR